MPNVEGAGREVNFAACRGGRARAPLDPGPRGR